MSNLKYNCKITMGDQLLHDKNYKNLHSIAEDIGISYHIVQNLLLGRKPEKKWQTYIYKQTIEVTKNIYD